MERNLLESANVLVLVLDRSGTIVRLNRFAERTIGYSRKETAGKNWFQLVGDGRIPEGFRRAFDQPVEESINISTIRCRSGEARVIEWRNTLLFSVQEVVEGMLSVGVDITDRHFAILNFASEESTFRNVFENASQAMLVGAVSTNPGARRRLTANAALLRMLGYASEELDGMSVNDLIHPQDLIEERRLLHEILRGDRDSYRLEMRLLHKSGDYMWARATVLAVRSDPTRAIMVIFVEDLTQSHRAEEALHESTRELRVLEARLAETQEEERQRIARELHDQVSQDLTSLSINLQLAQAEIEPSNDAALSRLSSAVDLIDETAGHIRDLTFDLRTPLLEDSGLSAALIWHAKRFERRTGLVVRIGGENPSVRLPSGTEIALFRITQEALSNVVKHARASYVDIEFAERNGYLELSIRDDGIGFDVSGVIEGGAESDPRWGLLNMRARAEALGGSLDVSSSSGEGTCVMVKVPR